MNNNLIPNGDYYAKLSADEQAAVKEKALEFQQSQLAEDIRETFRPKTYEESWGGLIWALEVIILNALHFLSAAAAFLGVVWVLSLIFLLFPFMDYPLFETLGETVLLGNVIAVLSAFPVLYYIEKFKAVALKNLFSKTIPPTLRASLPRGAFWRLIANGFFWSAVSFSTSLFGGLETPEAVYKKPEPVRPVGLVAIDSTKIKGDQAVTALQTQYAGLIAAQDGIIERNRKAATSKPITNWGAYNAYQNAKTERARLTTELGDLIKNQQGINLLALEVSADDNKAQRAEAESINKQAAAEYENKINFSAWLLGGTSVCSDFGIILIIFFSIRFRYKVALENDAISRLLFNTVPPIIIPENDPEAGKTGADDFELEQLEQLQALAEAERQRAAEAQRLAEEKAAAEAQKQREALEAERQRLAAEREELERQRQREAEERQREKERQQAAELERQRQQLQREKAAAEAERQRLEAERIKLENAQKQAEAERQRAAELERQRAQKEAEEKEQAAAELAAQKNKGFVINPVNFGGVAYSVTDIQTIIQNLPMYYRRANAPISDKATGQNLINAQQAKADNLKKVEVWRGVLGALGITTTPTDKGGLKLTYPKK